MLALAVTTHLYPRLDPEAYGAGRLTKIRAQAVSGRSCRAVAERLGLPERLRAAAPPDSAAVTEALIRTERVLASVIEAVIGACYLHHGYEATTAAVVDAFSLEIEQALERPADFKSALQERLARRGDGRRLPGDGRGGPAARQDLRGGGARGRRRALPRLGALEEGRRAGGRRGRARVDDPLTGGA